jgi:4-hydroxy-4-methyl-2-oxoglutarate aldolase
MVHAAMAALRPGEVLVLTMPEPAPVALLGDLLATQALVHGAAGVLVDAAVRDCAELEELGLPIWARWVRSRGATKDVVGALDVPVVVGGARIRTGDLVVLDADGGTVVAAERADEVLGASLAREAKERVKRERLQAGALSYDLDGLRAIVEGTASP